MHSDKNRIIDYLHTLESNSVESLVHSYVIQSNLSEIKVKNLILKMIDEDDIVIKNPRKYHTLGSFLTDIESLWFWLIFFSLVLYHAATIVSITFKELSFFRYVLGGLFTYFIPGFATVKAIYLSPDTKLVEQIALSVTLSLVITPATSYILNYTPWGITLVTISISISILSMLIAVIGIYRRYTMYL